MLREEWKPALEIANYIQDEVPELLFAYQKFRDEEWDVDVGFADCGGVHQVGMS